MKLFTRIVFGFNTLYQIIVGLMALILPAIIIEIYQGTPEEQHLAILRAAFRSLGIQYNFGRCYLCFDCQKSEQISDTPPFDGIAEHFDNYLLVNCMGRR